MIAWRSDPSPLGGGALIFRIFNFDGTPVFLANVIDRVRDDDADYTKRHGYETVR